MVSVLWYLKFKLYKSLSKNPVSSDPEPVFLSSAKKVFGSGPGVQITKGFSALLCPKQTKNPSPTLNPNPAIWDSMSSS